MESIKLKQTDPAYEKKLIEKNEKLTDEQISGYLRISIQRVEEAKERVIATEGHLRLFVHSFFSVDTEYEDAHKKIEEYFLKSVAQWKSQPKSSEIIFLEDPNSIKIAEKFILGKFEKQTFEDLIKIVTYEGSGVPYFEDTTEQGVSILASILFSLGVRTLTLSGMYLGYDPSSDLFDGCLGQVTNSLREKGFGVGFSENIADVESVEFEDGPEGYSYDEIIAVSPEETAKRVREGGFKKGFGKKP